MVASSCVVVTSQCSHPGWHFVEQQTKLKKYEKYAVWYEKEQGFKVLARRAEEWLLLFKTLVPLKRNLVFSTRSLKARFHIAEATASENAN